MRFLLFEPSASIRPWSRSTRYAHGVTSSDGWRDFSLDLQLRFRARRSSMMRPTEWMGNQIFVHPSLRVSFVPPQQVRRATTSASSAFDATMIDESFPPVDPFPMSWPRSHPSIFGCAPWASMCPGNCGISNLLAPLLSCRPRFIISPSVMTFQPRPRCAMLSSRTSQRCSRPQFVFTPSENSTS